MSQFGLIGKSLSHSFSKNYFEKKFREAGLSHTYDNFEMYDISGLREWAMNKPELRGLNVTIPYKESVIPLLDELSDEAAAIGAVNCIKIKSGRLTGHNTDTYGFTQSIKPFLDHNHERALILGTGGASKAVAHALKQKGLDFFYVTSSATKKTSNTFFYSEINETVMQAFKLIVNTTPLGMFPQTDTFPDLPYDYFSPQHLAYDLIYNPAQTVFLAKAAEKNAIIVNGLSMLQLQAEKSWEIWETV